MYDTEEERILAKKKSKKKYYENNKDIINERRKTYQKEYREIHKDELNEKRKIWYNENKEKQNESCKEYHKENKNKIAKRKKDKYFEDLDLTHQKQKEYRDKNIDNIKHLQSEWRKNHRVTINSQLNNARELRRLWYHELRYGLSCEICGRKTTNNNLAGFTFHHINPEEKETEISKKLYIWSKERLLEEIGKCQFLCFNCHKLIHASKYISIRPKVQIKMDKYQEFMHNKHCNICNESRIGCLEWHHIMPENKKFTISRMMSGTWSFEAMLEEINKCECVCGFCHHTICHPSSDEV